jgi:hypothetical protein
MRKTNSQVVAIGHTRNSIKPISQQQWEDIEDQCGVPIRRQLRLEYQRALNLYAACGPGSKKWARKSVLDKQLDVWEKRTKLFRSQLSEKTRLQSKHEPARKGQQSLRQIIQRHFTLDRYSKPGLSTHDLSFMLEGSVAFSRSLWKQICRAKGADPIEYWLVWVSLLISMTRKDGTIKVAWTKGRTKGIGKPFIHLVQELQELLPPDYVPRRKFNSIHKGIILALRIAQGSPVFELKSILRAWHAGDFGFLDVTRGGNFFQPGRVTFRIQTQMRRLRSSENLTGTK